MRTTYTSLQILLLTICFSKAIASYSEAYSAYEMAVCADPAMECLHDRGMKMRQGTRHNLEALQTAITEDLENGHSAIQKGDLHAVVLKRIQEDASDYQRFTQTLKSNYKIGNDGVTYQLWFNKMEFVANFAAELAQNPVQFYDILDGHYPQGYSIEPQAMNYWPDEESIYSNGRRANALKYLLLSTWLELHEGHTLLTGPTNSTHFLQHPFIHATPFPKTLDTSSFPTKFFREWHQEKYLMVIHNGYAFGGMRNEPLYANVEKEFGPMDCSELVALNLRNRFPALTQPRFTFSTLDQLQLHYSQNGLPENILFSDEQTQNYLGSVRLNNVANTLSNYLSDCTTEVIHDFSHLQPGMIHAERTMNPAAIQKGEDISSLNGSGGHTGVVIGTIGSGPDTQLLTISAARDLDDSGKEFSYGVEARPMTSTDKRKIMYFRAKE